MAVHVRHQIREALAVLLAGLTTTQGNVFTKNVSPLQENQLPALVIETDDESIEAGDVNSDFVLDRSLDLIIRIVAKNSADVPAVLDASLKEVETKLYESLTINTLNGLVKSINLQSIDGNKNGEIETPIGQLLLTCKVNYLTRGSAPDVSI